METHKHQLAPLGRLEDPDEPGTGLRMVRWCVLCGMVCIRFDLMEAVWVPEWSMEKLEGVEEERTFISRAPESVYPKKTKKRLGRGLADIRASSPMLSVLPGFKK